jgi:hypothetical protein
MRPDDDGRRLLACAPIYSARNQRLRRAFVRHQARQAIAALEAIVDPLVDDHDQLVRGIVAAGRALGRAEAEILLAHLDHPGQAS